MFVYFGHASSGQSELVCHLKHLELNSTVTKCTFGLEIMLTMMVTVGFMAHKDSIAR